MIETPRIKRKGQLESMIEYKRECDGYPVVLCTQRDAQVWSMGHKEKERLKREKTRVSHSLQRLNNHLILAFVAASKRIQSDIHLTVGKYRF